MLYNILAVQSGINFINEYRVRQKKVPNFNKWLKKTKEDNEKTLVLKINSIVDTMTKAFPEVVHCLRIISLGMAATFKVMASLSTCRVIRGYLYT